MSFESASPFLIILSIIIGILSSYTALIMVERISDQNRSRQIIWIFSGSIVMGMGIFSMHFIGMMAFHIGSPLTYHPFLLFVSLFAAIIASFSSFYILHVKLVTKAKVVLSGFTIGTGIVSMHYIGMMAIAEPVNLQFNFNYFILSILTASESSTVAAQIFFEIKETNASVGRKVASAVIL